nr:CapA family protein [Halomonas populi]
MVGQSLVEHKIEPHDADGWVELEAILKEADFSFTNLEVTVKGDRESWPMKPLDWCTRPDASSLDCLKKLGFNVLSLANNHAWDLGPTGVLDTIELVGKEGFKHAGTGVCLEDAEAPVFVDTPGGRVALIAMASGNLPEQAFATAKEKLGSLARPGVNPILVRDIHAVPRQEFERLAATLAPLGYAPDADGYIQVGEQWFAEGERHEIKRVIDAEDRARHLRLIAEAAEQADIVLVYLHQHHWEQEWQQVGEWLQDFAHDCIDAGAHGFLGHGVPMLQAVEIYKEKPIFYSLGNFIFHPTAGPSYWPDHRCWQSVIVEASFADGSWQELKLHPITLGKEDIIVNQDMSDPSRLYPLPAEGRYGQSILEHLRDLSAPFDCRINVNGDVGEVLLREVG